MLLVLFRQFLRRIMIKLRKIEEKDKLIVFLLTLIVFIILFWISLLD